MPYFYGWGNWLPYSQVVEIQAKGNCKESLSSSSSSKRGRTLPASSVTKLKSPVMKTACGACRVCTRVSQWGEMQVRHSEKILEALLLQLKTVTTSLYHKQITSVLQKTLIYLTTATVCLLSPLARINDILATFFLYLLRFPEVLIILIHLLWNPSSKSSLVSLELQHSALRWIQ